MTLHRAPWLVAGLCAALAPALSAQRALHAIHGSSPTDIWAVGEAPAALHWDGRSWSEVPFGSGRGNSLYGVWAAGPRDVFAVGDGGTVLRFAGGAWSRMTVPTDQPLVAVVGRSSSDVYALAQSSNEREAPQLLHYDGRAWTASPLPFPFRASALALAGRDVLVAGVAYFDPKPTERRQAGLVARWTGGRWVASGWDGQRVSDAVVGGAGWTGLSSAGAALLLFGQKDDGTRVIATSSGGAWSLLPPAASSMSNLQVRRVALVGDGTPVALFDGDGIGLFKDGSWSVTSSQEVMRQMMYPQPQPGATPAQQQEAARRQQQLMAQLQANPMLMAARMQAYNMSGAQAVWGPSADDFYVATEGGRIVHVAAGQAAIVYDATCADPSTASANPICRAIGTSPR